MKARCAVPLTLALCFAFLRVFINLNINFDVCAVLFCQGGFKIWGILFNVPHYSCACYSPFMENISKNNFKFESLGFHRWIIIWHYIWLFMLTGQENVWRSYFLSYIFKLHSHLSQVVYESASYWLGPQNILDND